jgi:3-oxoacyl-[acyl-carrier protein] reductase
VGFGIAMRLGREGARIILVEADRDRGERVADMLDAEGIEGRLLVGDIADPSAAKWAVTTAQLVWERLDIVVHSTAGSSVQTPIHRVNLDALDECYQSDLRAPLLFCQAAIPKMIDRGYGRIVTVASEIGKEGRPFESVRSSTQAALVGLTKAVAMSVADTEIRVNAVVSSELESHENDEQAGGSTIGRAVTVNEIVSAACWLASEECSFTTGATFDATAGRSTY